MSQMSLKLIVGLGNPDKHFLSTRHNVGFWLLDNLVEKLSKNLSYIKKFDSDICELEHNSHQIYLMKPLSYINNSGVPIKKYIKKYIKIYLFLFIKITFISTITLDLFMQLEQKVANLFG